MKRWIYLRKESNGLEDVKAAALAAVLSRLPRKYNVVHTNIVSKYLRGLENVNIGYPNKSDGDIVISLQLPNEMHFQTICSELSKSLGISKEKKYEPYLGFVRNENEIDRQLSKLDNIILYSYSCHENNDFRLSDLQEMIDYLSSHGYMAVCYGAHNHSLIKGSYDYRELISVDEIIKNRGRIKGIVTSLPLVKEVGSLLHIPVICDNKIIIEDSHLKSSQNLINTLNFFSSFQISLKKVI